MSVCQSPDGVSRPLRRAAPFAHAAIVTAVLGAVGCSVGAQYGVKFLVDTLIGGPWFRRPCVGRILFSCQLIAADNLLWRVASWIASYTFVGVTGDLRRDLFRHLTGHAPSYFADRMPGTLTAGSRRPRMPSSLENMFVWNVLPPCVATVVAIVFVATVSLPMALALTVVAGDSCFHHVRLAAAGRPLHHEFADEPPPSTARWWMSSAICRWSGRSAAFAASTAVSMPPSITR